MISLLRCATCASIGNEGAQGLFVYQGARIGYTQGKMSEYYNPFRKTNVFDPASNRPFKLSRSKLDLYLNCPRCFYLDRRLGVGQPPGYPFNLNSAVDKLLKKEFDEHRRAQTPHPLMEAAGLSAVPFQHPQMDSWRDTFTGVQYFHEPTNFLVTGAVDDIWVLPTDELIVVDYKATSKAGEVTLDADWQIGYKRQMEIYQWLLRHNDFAVSPTGYFVYCNGKTDVDRFNHHLEFVIKLLPYLGDDRWVEPALEAARACLTGDTIPAAADTCDFCLYRKAVQAVLPAHDRVTAAQSPPSPFPEEPTNEPKRENKQSIKGRSQPLRLFEDESSSN